MGGWAVEALRTGNKRDTDVGRGSRGGQYQKQITMAGAGRGKNRAAVTVKG